MFWPTRSSLRTLGFRLSARVRAKRSALFHSTFSLEPGATVLDLGGGTGAHVRMALANTPVRVQNICVADVNDGDLAAAASVGHRTVKLPEAGALPFADQEFDLVWCSSVIEHATGDKSTLWEQRDSGFSHRAFVHQRAFANEIRRIGRSYWVQTPAKSFPVETHVWLPFPHWLPRHLQVAVCRWSLEHWPHGSDPDFNLLTKGQMRELFPDGAILRERFFGLTKSWIAAKVAAD